ncbi:protein hypothetical protein [Limosa lapponica baueri]|uniref:Wntless-like transmembrane domain-containing protein n=1 Tax=Limosa lapponica baueri TaxID=1758121 RepID=A0A2I0T4F9_LIMLA|nr:protein hypothetical protein [Limosa lapponica baueri]
MTSGSVAICQHFSMTSGSVAIFQCFSNSCGSQSLVIYEKRPDCSMHMLISERVPLSEPSLGSVPEENAEITLDVSLAYRDDMFDDWEEIAHAIEIRKLKCTFGSPKVRVIFALGISMTFINIPVEWFSIGFDWTWMLLFGDIRQGIFYAMLLSFWIIFCGEHMMDQNERNRLSGYWKQVGPIAVGSFCLFVFDMCERGVQLKNPFYSIWTTEVGTELAVSFQPAWGRLGFCW